MQRKVVGQVAMFMLCYHVRNILYIRTLTLAKRFTCALIPAFMKQRQEDHWRFETSLGDKLRNVKLMMKKEKPQSQKPLPRSTKSECSVMV